MIQVQWNAATQEEAEKIIKTLLENRLVACANFSPIMSHYIWKGEYFKENEIKVYCKTTQNKIDPVFDTIQKLSSYEVCEILAFDVISAAAPYLCWVEETVGDATVSPKEFSEFTGPSILLDVRTPEEYQSERLKEAKRFEFQDQEIQDLLAWRKKHLDAPIFLICQHGRRSLLARHQLRAMGFEKVFSIDGGLEACKAFGLKPIS